MRTMTLSTALAVLMTCTVWAQNANGPARQVVRDVANGVQRAANQIQQQSINAFQNETAFSRGQNQWNSSSDQYYDQQGVDYGRYQSGWYNQPHYSNNYPQTAYYSNQYSSGYGNTVMTSNVYTLHRDNMGREYICDRGQRIYFDAQSSGQSSQVTRGDQNAGQTQTNNDRYQMGYRGVPSNNQDNSNDRLSEQTSGSSQDQANSNRQQQQDRSDALNMQSENNSNANLHNQDGNDLGADRRTDSHSEASDQRAKVKAEDDSDLNSSFENGAQGDRDNS